MSGEMFLGEKYHGDVGIDIGKRRIAYGWPSWERSGSFDLGKKPGPSRDWELRQMQHWLTRYIPVGAHLWVDQAFAGVGNVATAQSLSETISAVMTAAEWEHPPVLVHSSTWKSGLVGDHLASKAVTRAWLVDYYPDLAVACTTEDEVDAMVIGLYGQMRSNGGILPPPPRRHRRRTRKAG